MRPSHALLKFPIFMIVLLPSVRPHNGALMANSVQTDGGASYAPCTVRILQGAWRPSEGTAIISGNQAHGRPPRAHRHCGRSMRRPDGLGVMGETFDTTAPRSTICEDVRRESPSKRLGRQTGQAPLLRWPRQAVNTRGTADATVGPACLIFQLQERLPKPGQKPVRSSGSSHLENPTALLVN
jgi:hypothetical protein